ncbi:hypothetical protein G9C98_004121 [Cotesia typhae]|uniref:STAS domain-containing protein n=1 Tax=Cotesia typhae TaxID=2053667 RepID=A0A8J5V7G7_9HYME|nr:hypothetical protein G9C98_004121 [Cotesia typhae]
MANKIKAVFIDLSGTIHIDNNIIPGAIEALKKLRSTSAKIKFVTNTTKESKSSLHNRLINLGFDIKKDEIFSSLAAARELVIAKKLNPFLIIDPAAMEDFEDLIKTNEESNAVVLLEYSANVKAEVVGKPTEKFFTTALDGISPSEAVMIGDDIRDDIGGAQAVGIRGILVKTGKYRPDDEKLITPPPTKVVSSFVEAVNEIIYEMNWKTISRSTN